MKAKKKLLALALSAVTGVSAFGLALHLTSPNTVSAASSYTVTNLEDLVDSGKDIRWTYVNSKLSTVYQGTVATPKATVNGGVTELGDSKEYQVAIYDRKSAVGDKEDVTYIKDSTTQGPTEMNVNANDYDGNYSFFANRSDGELQEGGVLLPKVNDKNAVISFNMNYTDRRVDFYSRWVKGATNTVYVNPGKTAEGSYYGVTFNKDDTFIAFRNAVGNKATEAQIQSASKEYYVKDDVLAEANRLNERSNDDADPNNDEFTLFNQVLEKHDIINVTYGTYDGENGNAWTYFCLYNVTKELYLFDKAVDLGVKDNNVYVDDETTTDVNEKTYASGTDCMMKIEFSHRSTWDNANWDRTPVTIAGVTEPLLANSDYDMTLDDTYAEGAALSTVTLPTGYKWANPNQELEEGTKAYEAIYKYDTIYADTDGKYYGLEGKACEITVTAEVPSYTLTLKDMNGDTIGTRSVRHGESYTFEPYAAVGGTKTFVAYKVGEYLYKEGETVTPVEDSVATLWEADFSIANEGSVRLIDDGTNYGGIRWTMNIDATDYEIINDKVSSVSTMIIPTDLIEGDLNYDEAGAQVTELEAADLANGTVDFAITNIQHFNYNRPFSGAAFMKVEYTSGADYVYAEAKSFSVYELACDALAAHYAKLEESDGAMGKYSANGVAMLEKYIAGVIDLTVTDDGANLTVAGSTVGDGVLLGDLGYVVTNATQAKATEGKTTVTVSIVVDEDSALASLVQVGAAVPVIVRNAGALETYKAVEATATSYDGTALTISVKI
ncbi:MAG: hypothetical protein J6B56_03135 [Clostridia bacterium]|nr:hypothetical protein [Clostridia bacterium]